MAVKEAGLPEIEFSKIEPSVRMPNLRAVKSNEILYSPGVELTAEYVMKHTEFKDVTTDCELLEATLRTVAANYAPLANPEHALSQDDVYDLLCKDGNEVEGRSVVLAAVTELPHQQGRVVTSTMRFVFGTDQGRQGLPPIAEMDLVDAVWPNEREGKPYSTIATVGRYCLTEDVRKLHGIPGHLTGNLLRLGFNIGKQKYPPVEFFAAVMPQRVVRNVKAGNIEVRALEMQLKRIPGYELGLDLSGNTEALDSLYSAANSVEEMRRIQEAVSANAYYLKFSKYWLPHLYGYRDAPSLHEFIVPQEI